MRSRCAAALFLLLWAPRLGGAQLAPEAIADSARALLQSRGVPGGQVVILRDGEPVVRVAYGLAHVDSARAVDDGTRFRIGSISKLLTATAAAALWERGELDLDAPVTALVPEFTAAADGSAVRVTSRLLAGHLGGVRHYVGRDFMRATARYDDVIGPLEIFAADSLVAEPGTRYQYTSYGYNLLGAVLQRASGTEFRALVEELVLRPFGLARTVAERSDSLIPGRAATYSPSGTTAVPAPRTDLSDRWPSGGYLSTASDIARFGDQSVRGPVLSARVRTLLFTPMTLADGTASNVGFGWRVGTDPSGEVVYHHGGASIGGRAMLVVWRDRPLAVAITTNLSNARISEADAIGLGLLAAVRR